MRQSSSQNTGGKDREPLFSEEEMALVRSTNLPDFLAHLGYHVQKAGHFYTTAEMDSLRIKNNRTFFRYSTKQHGDAVTFLQEFRGMKFKEAVEYILAWHGRARDSPVQSFQTRAPPSQPIQQEKREFYLPIANDNQRRVYAYLKKRGIAGQVIDSFIRQNLLYEDALRHNCVFVGRNQDGKAVFANKRGTYDRNGTGFKGDQAGSDKSVAFRLPCEASEDWVCVFEAPIDLMSFCTLHRKVHSNAVALCGLSERPLDTYLKENPHLHRIVLCLDADGPGQEAAKRMAEKYLKQGYEVQARLPAWGKDWNEDLQRRMAVRQQTR